LRKLRVTGSVRELLLKLYNEVKMLRRKRAFSRLAEILTEEELNDIIESSRSFRKGFDLR